MADPRHARRTRTAPNRSWPTGEVNEGGSALQNRTAASIALWWLRRDLRLTDNQALSAALHYADQVIPVFVLDPAILDSPRVGPKRIAFLLGGLRSLDDDLRDRGSRLVVRRGDPLHELAALLDETGADAVFAEEDFSPYARQRDRRAAERLPLRLVSGPVVHPPGTILKADGTPYVVFTPFSRRWKDLPRPELSAVLPAPRRMPSPSAAKSLPIPTDPTLPPTVPFPPSESAAQRRLHAFTDGDGPLIHRYANTRDRLDTDGTSQLSPYLRLGMLSACQAVATAFGAIDSAPDSDSRTSAQAWLEELIWREFYVHILYHFPYVLDESFRANLRSIPWQNDKGSFVAWCEGRTGYPVVDAAMHQLTETGWMHNRARMIVASFLVKDLLIDWRWGERFFMQQLVDGDHAANNGGWQWTAGTGTDAAPYFRIFNSVSQGKRHDPRGTFVRRWVPELANLPTEFVHEPWKMPPGIQDKVGCVIGRDYPHPIVDHVWARERALAAYAEARKAQRR